MSFEEDFIFFVHDFYGAIEFEKVQMHHGHFTPIINPNRIQKQLQSRLSLRILQELDSQVQGESTLVEDIRGPGIFIQLLGTLPILSCVVFLPEISTAEGQILDDRSLLHV